MLIIFEICLKFAISASDPNLFTLISNLRAAPRVCNSHWLSGQVAKTTFHIHLIVIEIVINILNKTINYFYYTFAPLLDFEKKFHYIAYLF